MHLFGTARVPYPTVYLKLKDSALRGRKIFDFGVILITLLAPVYGGGGGGADNRMAWVLPGYRPENNRSGSH
jgi:hypothetical protein